MLNNKIKMVAVMLLTANMLYASNRAVEALVKRIIPNRAAAFVFTKIENQGGPDVFEIMPAVDNKIEIRGTTPLAMASGFHWYLKHVAKCQLSWTGDQLKLPAQLPSPQKTIRKESPYKYGCCFNYCTFCYSMPWWDWKRWEREIDYMALCGINMPLAIVGTEAVWMNTLKHFGYSASEAKKFIAGPAYTAWWLMGNLEGRGGPVSDEWIASRVELQKKILKRMRSLGMKVVLPGFVGLVPSDFSKHNNVKTLDQGKWCGNNIRPHVLDPDDPMFAQVAEVWYDEQEKLYGKADAFAGDLFHEGGKTHGVNVAEVAKKVQGYMLEHNPDAIWTLQGWGGNPRRDLLTALKKKNTLVIELCNEFWRRWENTKGFYGYPWCFSTIIMYGGNIALHGRLENIRRNLNDCLNSQNPPVALGTTWESIEINSVVMDFIWDMRWRKSCPDLNTWLGEYAERRYGSKAPELKEVWIKLLKTGYGSFPGLRRPQESIFCAKPSLNVKKASPFSATIKIHYDQRELRDALKLLLGVSDKSVAKTATYKFDAVNLARQFLANAGQVAYREMVNAYKRKDLAGFDKASATFISMMEDQDELLGTEKLFLLGKWLHNARKIAPDKKQADLNERNARLLISTWNEERSILRDYAWKEWNGMIKNYYLPRWEMYIMYLRKKLKGEKTTGFDTFPFEHKWAMQYLKNDNYLYEPSGDPVSAAQKVFSKWGAWLDKHYNYTSANKALRGDFIGAWQYKCQNAVWKRVLRADGKLFLYRNGELWKNWKGFTWEYDDGKALLKRKNGSVFTKMILIKNKAAARFEGQGLPDALKLEDGKNREAEGITE